MLLMKNFFGAHRKNTQVKFVGSHTGTDNIILGMNKRVRPKSYWTPLVGLLTAVVFPIIKPVFNFLVLVTSV